MTSLLDAPVYSLLLTLILCLLASAIAWRAGFFRLPQEDKKNGRLQIGFLDILGAFGLYFLIKIFFLPLVLSLLTYFEIASEPDKQQIQWGWGVLLVNLIAGAFLIIYFAKYDGPVRRQIWGGAPKQSVRQKLSHLFLGIATWFVTFPWIMFNMQLINLILQILDVGHPIDQEAVKLLKQSIDDPWLLASMVVSLAVVVPWIEELLFRGFFFCWAKGAFGRWVAIPLSAALFALFHFSADQSYENIGLISSIFILGCFLAFLRERQCSLWAPIGLHGIFNLISSQMILDS